MEESDNPGIGKDHWVGRDDRPERSQGLKSRLHTRLKAAKRQAVVRLSLLAVISTIAIILIRALVFPHSIDSTILYLQLAEIAVVGYFSIVILSELVTKLVESHYKSQARFAKNIIRIGGMLIVLSIMVVMLAKDPYLTIAVTTAASIVMAISIQSIIGNAIAGMVLAIVRPFHIGDVVTVFGITGSVRDIGLLYVRLTTTADAKTVLVPNGTMLGTAIVKERASEAA